MKIINIEVLFFVLVFCTNTYAQTRKSDSLRKILSVVTDDSLEVVISNNLISELTPTDSVEVRSLLEKNILLSQKRGSSYLIGDCYLKEGIFHIKLADYETAMNDLTKAINLFERKSEKYWILSVARTQIVLGSIYHQQGDFKAALELYLKSEEIVTRNNDYPDLRNVISKIGDCYFKLNQFDKAGVYAKKNLDIIPFLNDPSDIISVYIDYGNWLNETNKYEEGLLYYQKAEKLLGIAKNQLLYHTYYYNYAFLLSRKEKYNEALDYYQKAYVAAVKSGIIFDQIDATYKIGLMKYYMKDYQGASSILQDALGKAVSIKSVLLQRNIYDVLSFLEAERKNYQKAYEWLNKYIDTADSISSDEARKQINFINARYKARERTYKIEKLEAEKKVQYITIQRKNEIVITLSAILLVSVIACYILYRNFKIKREISKQKVELQEQQIQRLEHEKQIIALNSTLQGEETERSRLARDLHDGLGGLLSGLKLTLMNINGSAIISKEAIKMYNHAIELLDTSINELRHVAHNLMPETLFRFGLRQSVSDFCNDVTAESIKVKFAFFGVEKRYDEKLEIASYRIVQELINNSIKHAEANEIMVQLVCEEERLSITVQDNGKGMDPDKSGESKGKGLANIRSRVASFGGHFDISSEYGKGTEANIEFRTKENISDNS